MVYVRPNTRPHIFNRSALKIDALNTEGSLLPVKGFQMFDLLPVAQVPPALL